MKKVPIVLLAYLLPSCTTITTPEPTISQERRIEAQPLPPDPATETIKGADKSDWVEPLEKGACLDDKGAPVPGSSKPCPPKSGIAESESRAARDGLYRIRYQELRRTFEADRSVWAAQRELYETRLKLADQALQKAKPDWFSRHALEIGLIGGFILGSGITLGISYVKP